MIREVDLRSTDELLAAADDKKQEIFEPAIIELHWRGTKDVLEGALSFCASEDPDTRAAGVHILSQLGFPDRTFPEECFDALIKMLNDTDNDVIGDAIIGLNHIDEYREKAVPYILSFLDHEHDYIRFSLAIGLSGTEAPEAIEVLLTLMNDKDDETRNWATFGIARLTEEDSPAIREALSERLDDTYDEVFMEAVCGLAARQDYRSMPYLLALLIDDPDDDKYNEAAKLLLKLDENIQLPSLELIQSLKRLQKFRSDKA